MLGGLAAEDRGGVGAERLVGLGGHLRAPPSQLSSARRRPRRGRGRPRRFRRGMPGPGSAPTMPAARRPRAGRRLRRASAARAYRARVRRPRIARVADPDRREPDLGRRAGPHLGAERGGEQLRAEADRRGPACSPRPPRPATRARRPAPDALRVPHSHRAAHGDGAGHLRRVGSPSPSSGRPVADLGAPSNAARIRCGPSQGACRTTSSGSVEAKLPGG